MSRAASSTVRSFALGIVVLASLPSHALEWQSVPAVTAGATTDSNIRLSPDDHQRAAQASLAASLDLAARDPGFSFRLHPELVALRYADDAEADRNNLFTTFDVALEDTRHSWTLGGSYARDSTLTSEFESSGLLGIDVERTQRSLATGFNHAVGPVGRIGLSVSATEIGYATEPSSPFEDYGYRVIGVNHVRSTSPRSSWRLSASKSSIDSLPGSADATNTALRAVWVRQFSQLLQGEIGFGAFQVSGGEAERRDPSASLSFAIARQWPRWTLRAEGARDVRPEHRGVLAREDAVTIEMQRRFGERVRVGVQLRGAQVATAFASLLEHERVYSQAGANVSWQVTRRLNLYAGVYERTQNSSFVERASGHAGVVSVSYRGG